MLVHVKELNFLISIWLISGPLCNYSDAYFVLLEALTSCVASPEL